MDGLLNNCICCLYIYVNLFHKNVGAICGDNYTDSFCSQIMLPTPQFYTQKPKAATLDDRLSSVLCPPPSIFGDVDIKFVLFDDSDSDCNDCNTKLEVYKQCYDDQDYCNYLSNCQDCSFTLKCNIELQESCKGYSFPSSTTSESSPSSHSETHRPSPTSASKTSTKDWNTWKTRTTNIWQTKETSTVYDKNKTTTHNFNPIITASSLPAKNSNVNTKTWIIVVCVLGGSAVILASVLIHTHKSRRRRRQLPISETCAIPMVTNSSIDVYTKTEMKDTLMNSDGDNTNIQLGNTEVIFNSDSAYSKI